jgi:pimeloyl-ACP methyl ester carboxylesterase
MRKTFVTNAATFLDERQDPDGTDLDLVALARFSAPALITRGDRSPPLYPAVTDVLARCLPRARQHLFAGAGHAPHVTMPKAFVGVVSGFLLGLTGPRLPERRAGADART